MSISQMGWDYCTWQVLEIIPSQALEKVLCPRSCENQTQHVDVFFPHNAWRLDHEKEKYKWCTSLKQSLSEKYIEMKRKDKQRTISSHSAIYQLCILMEQILKLKVLHWFIQTSFSKYNLKLDSVINILCRMPDHCKYICFIFRRKKDIIWANNNFNMILVVMFYLKFYFFLAKH